MSAFNRSKSSSTVVLVGDNGEIKKDYLLFLLAVCEGKSHDEFSKIESVLPSAARSADGSAIYTISCPNDTKLNILDTPPLGVTADEAQVLTIKNAIESLTTTVDAIIIIGDQAQIVLSPGITLILDTLESFFPRSVAKNIFFVFTNAGKNQPSFDFASIDLPAWFLREHVFPVDNMVASRATLQRFLNDPERSASALHRTFQANFDSASETLTSLSTCIDDCSIQACDIKTLYRIGTKIESQIYNVLAVKEGVPVVDNLVNEYSLLATSPDFMIHLELVLALLRAHPDIFGIDRSIQKLEALRIDLENFGDQGKFPRGFVVE